jgi:hypothetical protein
MRLCAAGYSTAASSFMVDIDGRFRKKIFFRNFGTYTALNDITPYMASHPTCHHTLYGITLYMATHAVWHHTLHGITTYMTSHSV